MSPIPSSEESVLGGVDHDGGQSRDEILNEALNGLMQEYHSLKHKYDELEDSSLAANNSQKEELDRLKLTLLSLEESRNELLSQHAELTAKFNGLDAMYTERVSKNAEQFEATIKQFNAENKLLLGFPAIKFTAASLSPSASSMEMRQPQLETADAGANSDKNTVALLTSDVIERCKYDQLVLDHHLSLSFINDLSVEKTMYHTAQRMSKIKLENLKASHSSALDLLSAAAMEIGAAGTAVSPDTLRRSRELRSSFESMANNQSSYGLFGATSTNVAEMGNEADNNEVSSVMPHTRILEPEDALSIYDVALNEHKASGKEQLLEMQVDELKEQTLQYEATITRLKHEIQHLVAQSHQDMESSNLAFTEKMDRVNAQLLQVSELKLAAESKIEDVNMQLEVQGAQYASILAIHTSTESELKETRESLSKLQCRLDELNNRQDSIEKENLGFQMSKLEMLKSSLEQEVAALTERLAITEQDLTAALGSKTLLEQDLEAEKAHSTQLGVSIADLQSQSATRIALLEEEIIQLQDTLSHRQVEISTLGETVASSQSDLFSTTQEKEILQQELQKLRENISIHLDIVNEMKSNHVSHKEEMDAMSTKLKVLEEVIAGKDTDNGNLINDINSIHTTHKNEMDSMSFKVRALEQEIANKESINGDLLRTIQTTKLEYEAAISTADLELARLSGQIEHLQSELEIVSASRDLLETMNRKSVLARELSYESIASESSKLIIQIASLEQKVSVLESQVSSGEQAIVSLEEQNGELGLKSVALETTLSKSNALNFSLQVQLATATQKLSRLETENSELLSTTAVIKTQADEAAARLESLIFTHSKTVQEIETTNTDLLAKIHSLEAKDNNESNSALHELKYQLESVQQERDELLVNYSQLYESRTVIEKKLTESNTNHSSIAQQLAVQRDRIHQLEAEISTKSSVEVSFVDAAASTNIDVVSVSQYDDRCSSLSLEISALQAELEATKSLLSSSQDKVAELDLLISDLDESRNQLLETTKSQTTEIANLEASFMEREALMSAHQLKETSDFESRLLDLKNQLEMKLTQESINKEIIASLEEKIKALNVKVSDLSEEIDDYKAQVKDLEVGIREKTLESTHVLEASSLDHEHSIAKIQSELDISKELVIRLEIERSEMESQIIIYKQEALHVKNSLEEIHQIASQQSEHVSDTNITHHPSSLFLLKFLPV